VATDGRRRARPQPLSWSLQHLEFFRCYFGITEHDTARAARDKIAGGYCCSTRRSLELPLMFDFLGVPDPERSTAFSRS
jgi:hypothetical protein